jgi:hypothetical protein
VKVIVDLLQNCAPARLTLICTAQQMKIAKGNAAPRSPQKREPSDAVHGMQQGASDGLQIQNFLSLIESLQLDRAERNSRLA